MDLNFSVISVDVRSICFGNEFVSRGKEHDTFHAQFTWINFNQQSVK